MKEATPAGQINSIDTQMANVEIDVIYRRKISADRAKNSIISKAAASAPVIVASRERVYFLTHRMLFRF